MTEDRSLDVDALLPAARTFLRCALERHPEWMACVRPATHDGRRFVLELDFPSERPGARLQIWIDEAGTPTLDAGGAWHAHADCLHDGDDVEQSHALLAIVEAVVEERALLLRSSRAGRLVDAEPVTRAQLEDRILDEFTYPEGADLVEVLSWTGRFDRKISASEPEEGWRPGLLTEGD